MRKIIVGASVSLDGVMQSPGGPAEDPTGGFALGGWVVPYFDEALGKAVGEMMASPFDLLLGRKTYDIFAAHWPHAGADNPIGALFDRITKFVATRDSKLDVTWQNTKLLGPDVVAALRQLKTEDGPDLVTQGSSNFLETLFRSNLVDEINLQVFPVVLGKGKRLFPGDAAPAAFTLVSSTATPSRVVHSR
jgi:dihydrofolate reductase